MAVDTQFEQRGRAVDVSVALECAHCGMPEAVHYRYLEGGSLWCSDRAGDERVFTPRAVATADAAGSLKELALALVPGTLRGLERLALEMADEYAAQVIDAHAVTANVKGGWLDITYLYTIEHAAAQRFVDYLVGRGRLERHPGAAHLVRLVEVSA